MTVDSQPAARRARPEASKSARKITCAINFTKNAGRFAEFLKEVAGIISETIQKNTRECRVFSRRNIEAVYGLRFGLAAGELVVVAGFVAAGLVAGFSVVVVAGF